MENKKEKIDLISNVVRDTKPRCKACYPCPMGVVGCDSDNKPHGHGGAKRCPECGVPYAYVHPHSKFCSLRIPIEDNVIHDDYHMQKQLEWKKGMIEKGMIEKGMIDMEEKKKNVHIDQLLMTLDSEQWKSLSHIRGVAYPVTLEDKRRLLSAMKVIA